MWGATVSSECFFCGERNKVVLQRHHLTPKVAKIENNQETIVLCANCHIKVHTILRPFLPLLNITSEQVEDEDKELLAIIASGRNVRTEVRNWILSNLSLNPEGIETDILLSSETAKNFPSDIIKDLLEQLRIEGVIYNPKPNWVRII